MNEIMTMVFFFVEMLVPTTQIFPPLASVDHQPQNVPEIIDRMSTNQNQNYVLRKLVFHLLHHDKSNYKEGNPHLVLTLIQFQPSSSLVLGVASYPSNPSLVLSKAFCPLFHPPAPLLCAPLNKLGRPPCDSCMVEKRRLCTCTPIGGNRGHVPHDTIIRFQQVLKRGTQILSQFFTGLVRI